MKRLARKAASARTARKATGMGAMRRALMSITLLVLSLSMAMTFLVGLAASNF